MQSVSAEQTQSPLSPVPRILGGDRDQKVHIVTHDCPAEVGTLSASNMWPAVGGPPV